MTVRILLGTAVLLVVASGFVNILFRQRIVEEYDDALEARADALMSLMDLDKEVIDFDFNEDAMPEFADPDEDEAEDVAFFVLALPDGTTLRGSPSLADHTLPRHSSSASEPDEPVFWNHKLPNGEPGRFLQIEFSPEIEEEEEQPEPLETDEDHIALPDNLDLTALRVVLVVGRSRASLNQTLGLMTGSLAALVVVVLAGIALVVRRAFKAGFQPVHDLNTQLRAIGPESLADRISLTNPREELATIERSVNHLLARIAAGYERERRFSSNVAHELRTPVSELRSACEVGGQWPDDAEEVRALFGDIREVGLHMEKIVETLLTLARCENGTMPVEREQMNLESLLQTCWQRIASEAEGKGIALELEIESGLSTVSDPNKLEMILQNLIENAVAHSSPKTTIRCTAKLVEGVPVVTVANQAVELRSEDLPLLFERCWQKHPTQTDQRRTGLGLSIAKALADLLGIRIEPSLRENGFFEVRLILAAAIP